MLEEQTTKKTIPLEDILDMTQPVNVAALEKFQLMLAQQVENALREIEQEWRGKEIHFTLSFAPGSLQIEINGDMYISEKL